MSFGVLRGVLIQNEKLLQLSEIHLNLFQARIERGGPGIRASECLRYAAIWGRGVSYAQFQPEESVHTARSFDKDLELLAELQDAHSDGSYSEFFED